MSIKDDFKNYIDGNGLNTPQPGTWSSGQSGSDNGPLFTSEYYIILKKNGQLTEQDKLDYADKINQCIGQNLLNRRPIEQNQSQEGPDDYYGVLNGCIESGNTDIPRKLLWGCIKNFGAMNNVSPGTWTTQSFLIRQPQLLCAMINASFPSLLNPLHWIIRWLAHPLYIISAMIIATSCINVPTDQTDPRRLAWHLLNNLKKTSLFCYLASFVWEKRLYKDYKNGMRDAAAIYYSPKGLDQNPYSKWWIT